MENNLTSGQKAMIITKLMFDSHRSMYIHLSDEQKHEVFLQLLNEVTEKMNETILIPEGLEGGIGDWFNRAVDWTSKAGEDVIKWGKNAAEDVADWTKNAAIDVADWTKQAAIDSYDWGKGAVNWAACKSCTATLSSFLNLSGATISLNLLVHSMLNEETDKEKKKQKIDAALDEVMNYLPKELNGVDIDKKVREKTKAVFVSNLDNNPIDFIKMCKSGIQYVISSIVCQVAGLCHDE